MTDTREASFLYAIVAAGALHAVADGCSKGRLPSCSCVNASRRPAAFRRPPPGGVRASPGGGGGGSPVDLEDWTWGGCTDDVAFAYAKSKQFIDVAPNARRGSHFRTMLRSHNYEAGRLVRFAVFMAALCNRGALYFCPVISIFFYLLFYSSPNLSGRRLDVYHTSTHGVALVRI